LLTDLRDQEIAHKEFIQGLLGSNAVSAIKTNFSAATFADRTSVLTVGAQLEDLVVAGFNGAAHLFNNGDYILLCAKMVTAEARHAAYFRDALNYNSFANGVIDGNGLDQSLSPQTVLSQAEKYILTHLDASSLPN